MAFKPLYTQNYVAFSPFDRLALAGLIRRAARPGCRMAEIGSWLGNGSTQVFLETLRTTSMSSLMCVDTWQGSTNVRRHQEIVRDYDVLGTFRTNVAAADGLLTVMPFVATSELCAPLMADGAFDLVFIDADHSYQAVRDDVSAWRLKVRQGGILCGHDCEARLDPANEARLREHQRDDTIPGDGTPFPVIHPGSILAVHEAFGGAAQLCADTLLTLDDGRPGRSTIWWMEML